MCIRDSHYSGFIASRSMRPMKDEYGNTHMVSFMDKGWMHGPPFRRDDGIMFCGYGGDGLYVLDATDVIFRSS